MINTDLLNSIPQIKQAIIALSKQGNYKLKQENIFNEYDDVFVQIKENTIYELEGNNINIDLSCIKTAINPISIFVKFNNKPSICVFAPNYRILAENGIKLNPNMWYEITLTYKSAKWFISANEFLNRGIESITPSGVVFP